MRSRQNVPFPRRAAASFNQTLHATGIDAVSLPIDRSAVPGVRGAGA